MTLRTGNYGNYGLFLIVGNAGFLSSTLPQAPQTDQALAVAEKTYLGF